ncbi:FadR/GntR family transcriptional regulator [Pedobacter sp. UBA5917]|uniref:FadR/GntR family transcriptional regulator n=1 Tax=Pedobacter sp. UBA5917 TaxID=1947061 RepID=UPI0025D533E7|nr:FadR/GntR family transcriptional regulator [Pedobacter sp. UBA5917]
MNSLIQKKSLAEEVATRLQQQISGGEYKIGEKLPIEPELMKAFGVGRSTVREAIKILSNSGLLKVQQGVGTFVNKTSSDNEPMDHRLKRAKIQDLDEIRQMLEMKIAEKASLQRTQEDIEQIKIHLAERNETGNAGMLKECIEADINFHVAIARASKNDILLDLYKTASLHLKNWFEEINKNTDSFTETQYLHQQLLNYIIAKDPKKAQNTAAKILKYAAK